MPKIHLAICITLAIPFCMLPNSFHELRQSVRKPSILLASLIFPYIIHLISNICDIKCLVYILNVSVSRISGNMRRNSYIWHLAKVVEREGGIICIFYIYVRYTSNYIDIKYCTVNTSNITLTIIIFLFI